MARTILAIPELWNDEISDLGASSRDIKLHVKILFSDGVQEWHYYGTPLPIESQRQVGILYVEHPSIHFPQDIFNLEDQSEALFALGFDVMARLQQI